MSEPQARRSPPTAPFVLSVGVTGHRADVIGPAAVDGLRERVRQTLVLLEEAGRALFEQERDCFASGPAMRRFVSPIADGADQIAAEVALELGWELQAVLPFDRVRYRSTLGNDGARERFDALIEQAACVLELPET